MSVVRAAFDVGSGSTKLTVGQVDTLTGQLIKIFFSDERVVLLGKSFKHNGDHISPTVLDECRAALVEFKKIAVSHGTSQWAGVATAVFREQKNGLFIEEINNKMGLNLRVVSQNEEAELGHSTGMAVRDISASNVTPLKNTVVWDSGGASFQLASQLKSDGSLCTIEGNWGSSSSVHAMVSEIQKKDFHMTQSPNPVSLHDTLKTIDHIKSTLSPPPSWFKVLQKEGVDVVAIGGDTSMFRLIEMTTGNSVFTPNSIMKAIEKLAGMSDDDLSIYPLPMEVLPKLALGYSVMTTLGIKEARHYRATGNTLGLLITRKFWPIDE
eukprot:CFRG1413T1